jgi:hypothetical protein
LPNYTADKAAVFIRLVIWLRTSHILGPRQLVMNSCTVQCDATLPAARFRHSQGGNRYSPPPNFHSHRNNNDASQLETETDLCLESVLFSHKSRQ